MPSQLIRNKRLASNSLEILRQRGTSDNQSFRLTILVDLASLGQVEDFQNGKGVTWTVYDLLESEWPRATRTLYHMVADGMGLRR